MRVLNLILHGVGEPPARPWGVGEERVWVSRAGLRSVLREVCERPDVRLTFDDGNRSDVEVALPELQEIGMSATFFVVAGRLGAPTYLDAAGVRELRDAGMRVQSHGFNHPVWRGLSRDALHDELYRARSVLEDTLERPVDEVAIPFCLYDRRVLRAVREAGYRHVFTCDGGYADSDGWLQARNQISAGEDGRKVAELETPSLLLRATRAVKAPIKRWR